MDHPPRSPCHIVTSGGGLARAQGEPLIYDTLVNYSHIAPTALQPVGAWARRPDAASASAITTYSCTAADGSAGVRDCSGAAR